MKKNYSRLRYESNGAQWEDGPAYENRQALRVGQLEAGGIYSVALHT